MPLGVTTPGLARVPRELARRGSASFGESVISTSAEPSGIGDKAHDLSL